MRMELKQLKGLNFKLMIELLRIFGFYNIVISNENNYKK